jgi:CTP synthase (UTP-ammonia lyase)
MSSTQTLPSAWGEAGLVISSVSAKEGLADIEELPSHPFYLGAQFHPEFQSKPNHPLPLFSGFIAAALEYAGKYAAGLPVGSAILTCRSQFSASA